MSFFLSPEAKRTRRCVFVAQDKDDTNRQNSFMIANAGRPCGRHGVHPLGAADVQLPPVHGGQAGRNILRHHRDHPASGKPLCSPFRRKREKVVCFVSRAQFLLCVYEAKRSGAKCNCSRKFTNVCISGLLFFLAGLSLHHLNV